MLQDLFSLLQLLGQFSAFFSRVGGAKSVFGKQKAIFFVKRY